VSGRASGQPFAERNGWRLFRHAEFRRAFERLATEVERLVRERPRDWESHPKVKLLRRILDLIEVETPRDPNAPEFAQGNTLGPAHRHWRRAKFMGRFRLFFRFDSASRMIVYAWVNDETTLRQPGRKAGARSDPYTVFAGKLAAGDPPADWAALLDAAQRAETIGPGSQKP
jgi:toxin YhaV